MSKERFRDEVLIGIGEDNISSMEKAVQELKAPQQLFETVKFSVFSHDGDIIGHMLLELSTQCVGCAHLNISLMTCSAFPDGIPDDIMFGYFDHTISYDGDNGIQFKQK